MFYIGIAIGFALVVLLTLWCIRLKKHWDAASVIHGAIAKEIEKQNDVILALPHEEAEARALQYIKSYALLQVWAKSIPADVAPGIVKLDAPLRRLFTQYRRIVFAERNSELGSDISSELMRYDSKVPGYMIIRQETLCVLSFCVKEADPVLYVLNGKRIVKTYPSLFHYILLAEGEEQDLG